MPTIVLVTALVLLAGLLALIDLRRGRWSDLYGWAILALVAALLLDRFA